MGDVTPIKPKCGDYAFLMCSCTGEGSPYLVNAIVGETPVIATLVCPECESVIPVTNGVVGETNPEGE